MSVPSRIIAQMQPRNDYRNDRGNDMNTKAWEDPSDEEDLDPEGEGVPVEELALDNPAAKELLH